MTRIAMMRVNPSSGQRQDAANHAARSTSGDDSAKAPVLLSATAWLRIRPFEPLKAKKAA
jgi:hypothetical protein